MSGTRLDRLVSLIVAGSALVMAISVTTRGTKAKTRVFRSARVVVESVSGAMGGAWAPAP